MSKDREMENIRAADAIHSRRIAELQQQYIWKAQNIVRFFAELGMTIEQKEKFLASELATIHWLVEIDAPSIRALKTQPQRGEKA
jgi:hypothetical protein